MPIRVSGVSPRRRAQSGFSLVELLVVMGVITVLIGILLPALTGVRRQANAVACRARMRDVGMHLLMYANSNGGWLFPTGRGTNAPREERWPTRVFKPAVYDPPILLCPEDVDPANAHSYLLNSHLPRKKIKYGRTALGGMNVSNVVVMGEKPDGCPDYYLEVGEFDNRVELFAHGLKQGSNYLFLDLHVSSDEPKPWPGLVDPWDVPVPEVDEATTKPTTNPS